jgi:hypothetical protein
MLAFRLPRYPRCFISNEVEKVIEFNNVPYFRGWSIVFDAKGQQSRAPLGVSPAAADKAAVQWVKVPPYQLLDSGM